jgi:high-affinity iron transporter
MLFSNALIGLREGLEAALVVVILVAFLVKTERQWALKYVWAGVATAVALSIGLGAVLTYGTSQLSFESQELIGGSASIVAVAFVTGMVFWMRTAARSISGELKGRLDRALDVGAWAVALVGFLGVGREGLETALFFYASVQTAGTGTSQPLIGFVIGIAAAVVMGVAMYKGAIRINLSKFFRYTGVLLVIVAAGILAYGIHDLQEAGVLPGLNTLAFDVSSVIPPDSWYGTVLRGTVNFTPATTVLQAIAWVLYTGVVLTLFLRPQPRKAPAAVRADAKAAADSTKASSSAA